MKKVLLVIVIIVAILAAAAYGAYNYVIRTPEYALKGIIEDVNSFGMDGLYPHLTGDAKKVIDTVNAASENEIVTTIMDFVGEIEYVRVLKTEIQKIQWGIKDLLKSEENATVILSFNYEDKLVGTIEMWMIWENEEWRINRLDMPKFDKIDWE